LRAYVQYVRLLLRAWFFPVKLADKLPDSSLLNFAKRPGLDFDGERVHVLRNAPGLFLSRKELRDAPLAGRRSRTLTGGLRYDRGSISSLKNFSFDNV
jgi:hypothetical protein